MKVTRYLKIKRCMFCPFCIEDEDGHICISPEVTCEGADYPRISGSQLFDFPDFCKLVEK